LEGEEDGSECVFFSCASRLSSIEFHVVGFEDIEDYGQDDEQQGVSNSHPIVNIFESHVSLDSPDRYVDLLSDLCSHAQIIGRPNLSPAWPIADARHADDHMLCFTGPCTPAYHSLPDKSYRQIEARITRAADFVRSVIVPFILDDFKQFFVSHATLRRVCLAEESSGGRLVHS